MSSECQKIHEIFNELPQYKFPFDFKKIPLNGIYVLFENGEYAHGLDRIVRIGTHTGDNLLRSRLKQHFLIENKDGSIFRKNIGRTILNIDRDPYLEIWNLVMTTKESISKYGYLIKKDYQKSIEKKVSEIIQSSFSFCVFEVNDKNQRLKLESQIISTVAQCSVCKPSNNWFGLFSSIEKIRNSGLWLVNELYKETLKGNDIKKIINFVNVDKGILSTSKIQKSDGNKIFYKEHNKNGCAKNIIWVNINKPTKKCTIHTSLSCQYVLSIKETNRKGIENLKIDGGWESFNSYIESINYCKKWEEDKGYTVTVCC